LSPRQTVSACIIARDEEDRLPAALRSVEFCDEVIVVDSGSRDRTVEVARRAGAKVIENPWPGFGAQRNVALDAASSDWILEVDADEQVTPELQAEIESFLQDPPEDVDICGVPRRNFFLGAWLGPSAKYPEYRLRMFRRGAYRHDESRKVHEGLWAFGRTWPFEGDLDHLLAANFGEAVRDARAYARLEAEQLAERGSARAYVRGIVLRPFAKFWYRLLLGGGWRDGWRGAVKIALDCASDALVWVLHLTRRGRSPAGGPVPKHFAKARERQGSVRLLALASGGAASARAAEWLRAARGAGADVALVTDSPPPADRELHVRAVERFTPLRVIRALDAELQLRGFDALVPCGRRERGVARLLPGELRSPYGRLYLDTDPAEAERRVREAARS
jgi:hypothetical protein